MSASATPRLSRAARLLLLPLATGCGADPDPGADRGTPPAPLAADGAPAPDASRPWAWLVPDSALVRRGACPFECCTYGRWASPVAVPLRPRPAWSAAPSATIPAGQPFQADSGFVRIEDVFLVLVQDTVTTDGERFEPGDTLVVLDYLGEGHFNVWHDGRVAPVSGWFWGAEAPDPRAETRGRYRREWWVHASAPGRLSGWLLADSVPGIQGADMCGGPAPLSAAEGGGGRPALHAGGATAPGSPFDPRGTSRLPPGRTRG